MKILIVDDSEAIVKIVGQMLTDVGHQPGSAKDGQLAVDLLKEDNSWDLILLDWNMPNMSGIEFLKYNQEHKIFNGPICMMTTEDDPEKIMMALEHGAVEYIMKPFTADIISTKINDVLEMKNVG